MRVDCSVASISFFWVYIPLFSESVWFGAKMTRMTRLNWERYSDHHACLQINILVVEKYSRFLWSITMSMGYCQDQRRWTWFILFFFSSFILFSIYFSIFLFLEQLGWGLISHAITSVTWWHSHKTDHETWESLVEDLRTDDVIQYGHHMLASWTTHGCLG